MEGDTFRPESKTAEPTPDSEEGFLLNLGEGSDPDKVIEVIGQIEGRDWADRQRLLLQDERPADFSDATTIKGILEALIKARENLARYRQELLIEINSEDKQWLEGKISAYTSDNGPIIAELYGANGFNRYYIRANGSITLDASHIIGTHREETIRKAGELGIRVA